MLLRDHVELHIDGLDQHAVGVYLDLIVFVHVAVGDMSRNKGNGFIFTVKIEGGGGRLGNKQAVARIQHNSLVVLHAAHREGHVA